jgi:hypothetical protein
MEEAKGMYHPVTNKGFYLEVKRALKETTFCTLGISKLHDIYSITANLKLASLIIFLHF